MRLTNALLTVSLVLEILLGVAYFVDEAQSAENEVGRSVSSVRGIQGSCGWIRRIGRHFSFGRRGLRPS